MAVLTHTELTARLPVGDRVMQSYSIAAAGDNAADEWIATGLTHIEAVVGCAPIGAAPFLAAPSFQMNARGTGVTVGANPGDLGVEVEAAGDNTLQVTVIGIP
jgi:hypothetical protein